METEIIMEQNAAAEADRGACRTKAVIHLDAIRRNYENMHALLSPGTKMIAVVKANAYGHGAVPAARALEPYPFLWGFAVATVEEALELKEAGLTKPVLILGYVFPKDAENIVRHDIRPAVFTLDCAKALSEAAVRLGKDVHIHIAADTGMSRIGVSDTPDDVELVRSISALPGIDLEGMFTHFAKADETDKTFTHRQYARFTAFAAALREAGVNIRMLHCSNSAAILELPGMNLDCVRAGITGYGIYPSDEVDPASCALSPAMEWKSSISAMRVREAGTGVSYGGTFVTGRRTRIATIPVGYADGYPRSLSSRGYVLIRGKKAPILGRVCMDQMMVDVTDIPEAAVHDEVTLLGRDGEAEITAQELGDLSGRFPYEFVCDVSARVPRVYPAGEAAVLD